MLCHSEWEGVGLPDWAQKRRWGSGHYTGSLIVWFIVHIHTQHPPDAQCSTAERRLKIWQTTNQTWMWPFGCKIDSAFVSGENLLFQDPSEVQVYCLTSSSSELCGLGCVNASSWDMAVRVYAYCAFSQDKPARLRGLSHHLLAQEQQCISDLGRVSNPRTIRPASKKPSIYSLPCYRNQKDYINNWKAGVILDCALSCIFSYSRKTILQCQPPQ